MRRSWLLGLACGCSAIGAQGYITECPPTVVEGVDVSAGQGSVNWSSVRSSGRSFAFVKATQGNYNMDVEFAANWPNTRSDDLLRSAYHFFDATIDGVTQADYFLSMLNANGGLRPGDLPPMLDLQCPTSSNQMATQPNCEYTGDSGWAPPSVIAQRVFDWLHTVEAATGRTPIIYSYPSWFADVGFTDARLANYPLFIATITTGSCLSVPAPWTAAAFWQYSFNGTVSGISGPVDLDRFIGSLGELQVLADTIFADGFDQ